MVYPFEGYCCDMFIVRKNVRSVVLGEILGEQIFFMFYSALDILTIALKIVYK